jgi:hypothetical protein
MAARIKHAALALAISMGALVGACGPATPPVEGPPSGLAEPGDGAEGTPATPGETPAATPTGEAATPDKPPAGASGPAKSTPLSPTQMEAELKKIGIDVKKIPDLEKIPLAQKKKVMPLLQKSLGFETCQGCHVEGDFKKETRNMKVAREMWRHFVVPLRTEQGGTLFCDSCHSGNKHVLNRTDRKAVEKFMEEEYEHKISQSSKKEMECGTCHGDAMELKIVEKLWGIAK